MKAKLSFKYMIKNSLKQDVIQPPLPLEFIWMEEWGKVSVSVCATNFIWMNKKDYFYHLEVVISKKKISYKTKHTIPVNNNNTFFLNNRIQFI